MEHCHGDFPVFRSVEYQNYCLVPLLILHIMEHCHGDFAVFRSVQYQNYCLVPLLILPIMEHCHGDFAVFSSEPKLLLSTFIHITYNRALSRGFCCIQFRTKIIA